MMNIQLNLHSLLFRADEFQVQYSNGSVLVKRHIQMLF